MEYVVKTKNFMLNISLKTFEDDINYPVNTIIIDNIEKKNILI